jgi:hypothetical protein
MSVSRLLHAVFWIAGGLAVSASHSFAQPKPDPWSAAYMWNPDVQKRLYELSLYLDKSLLGKAEVCGGKAWLQPISVAVLQPLSFPDGGTHPNKGAWTMRYRFDRCNESTTYNALFRANPQGPATVFHLPPGTTRASPQLMQDLNPALFTAASAKNSDNKDCKVVAVTDTSVTAQPAPVKVGDETLDGVWEEQWTVRTCSGIFSMTFCFIPEKTGGTTWTQTKCEPGSISTARALNRR